MVGAVGALCAPVAIAANQQVSVRDNAFVAATIAVTPGDTVTWIAGGGGSHNVSFNDGLYTFPAQPTPLALWPAPATRTFSTAGEYRYRCDLHGSGGMVGIVYVNATGTLPKFPPYASFTVLPDVATPGQTVTFNAAPSSDSDGTIERYRWDLDGDGSYETDRGTQETLTTSFATPGTRTIGLQVTDSDTLTHTTTQQLVVTNAPTPSFTVSPGIALTGQAVSFDGSASSDPDGRIARYEWDLDGNGSYEADTSEIATTSRTYMSPATLTIALRVSDNRGISAVTKRTLQVVAPTAPPPAPAPPPAAAPPPPPAPVTPPPPAAPGCEVLEGAARTSCMQKLCRGLTGARRASCISRSCRYVTGARRASCVQTSCRYGAKGKRASCNLASCRYLTGLRRKACNKKYARTPTAGSRSRVT